MSPLTDPVRLEVRRLVRRFGRVLLALFALDLLFTLVYAFLPDPHAVVRDFTAVLRFGLSLLLAWPAFRLSTLVKPISLFSRTAFTLALLSALFAIAPRFDIVPPDLGDRLWDALLGLLRLTAISAALALFFISLSRIASRPPLSPSHAALRLSPIAIAIAYPIALPTLEPGFLPSPLLSPILAFILTLILPIIGLLGWPLASLLAVGPLGLGITYLSGSSLDAHTLIHLSFAASILTLALALPPALHSLTETLSGRASDGPTPSFVRRLIGHSSPDPAGRFDDLPSSTSSASSDQSSLDLAYRELGLTPEPESPKPALIDIPPESATILPLVPRTRPRTEPRLPAGSAAEVIPFPSQRPEAPMRALAEGRALRLVSRTLLARGLITAFGLVLGASPLGLFLPALVLFDVALLSVSFLTARGLHGLRGLTPDKPLIPRMALFLGILVVIAELCLVVARLAELPRGTLLILSNASLFGALLCLLITLARVFQADGEDKLTARAGQAIALLLGLGTALGTLATLSALDASDLQWLAWPVGFASTGLGIGLWLSLLWLLKDAIDIVTPAGLDEP